jgi:hypothetical protein
MLRFANALSIKHPVTPKKVADTVGRQPVVEAALDAEGI